MATQLRPWQGFSGLRTYNETLQRDLRGLDAFLGDLRAKVASLLSEEPLSSSSSIAVAQNRILSAGAGLTGGGDLSADRTFHVGGGFGINVASDSVAVDQGLSPTWTGLHTSTRTASATGYPLADVTNSTVKWFRTGDPNPLLSFSALPVSNQFGQLLRVGDRAQTTGDSRVLGYFSATIVSPGATESQALYGINVYTGTATAAQIGMTGMAQSLPGSAQTIASIVGTQGFASHLDTASGTTTNVVGVGGTAQTGSGASFTGTVNNMFGVRGNVQHRSTNITTNQAFGVYGLCSDISASGVTTAGGARFDQPTNATNNHCAVLFGNPIASLAFTDDLNTFRYLRWSASNTRFELSSNTRITGTLTATDVARIEATGSVLTMGTGADANLSLVFNTSTADGTITYLGASTNQFQFDREVVVNAGLDMGTSGRFDSNVPDSGNNVTFLFQPTTASTPTLGTTRAIYRLTNSAGSPCITVWGDKRIEFNTSSGTTSASMDALLGVLGTSTFAGGMFFNPSSTTSSGISILGQAGTVFGAYFGSAATTATHITGAAFEAGLNGTFTTGASLYGAMFRSSKSSPAPTNTGSTFTSYGWKVEGSAFPTSAATGTVTNAYGGYIEAPASASARVTNLYGLYIEEQLNTSFATIKNGIFLGASDGSKALVIRNQDLYFFSSATSALGVHVGDSFEVAFAGTTRYGFTTNLLLLADAIDIGVGTSTGTKIGTAFDEKLGLWGVTPIVQPANTDALDDLLVSIGLRASGGVANFTTSPQPTTNGAIDLGANGKGWAALWLKDTAAAFELKLQATNTGISADRTLTYNGGDSDRTLTLSGNPTLADWFDQNVKTTGTPQHARLGVGQAADGTVLLAVNDAIAAPTLAGSAPTFTDYYGGNTNALGDPVAWLRIRVGGTTYKVPLYT